MDVAEDVRNAGLVKNHIARATRFIEAEIEALALKKRKHVVKEGIPIGKLHRRTDRHHQDMGLETLVLLNQTRPLGAPSGGQTDRRALPTGVSQSTTLPASTGACSFFPLFTNATSAVTVTSCAQAKPAQTISTHSQPAVAVFHNQNKIPIIRLNWSALLLTSLT